MHQHTSNLIAVTHHYSTDQSIRALNNRKQVATSFRITFFCPILTLKERMPKTLSPSTSGISWEIVQSCTSVPLWSKQVKQMARGSSQAFCNFSATLLKFSLGQSASQNVEVEYSVQLYYLGKCYHNGKEAHEPHSKPQWSGQYSCSLEYRGLQFLIPLSGSTHLFCISITNTVYDLKALEIGNYTLVSN